MISITEAELAALASWCEKNNIKAFQQGDFRIEMGPRMLQRSVVQGTTTDKVAEKTIEKQLFGNDLFEGLSDDQLLGLAPLPENHPLNRGGKNDT